jgi:tRNA A-37 threonylcarbamoyl transferase component Bud32/tetratricopeptide (TPR) repeat protein
MSSELLREQLQDTLGEGYRLERELGGGGMSHVFVATETALGRRVVVKVLPPELSGVVSADRFRREVQLAARLNHPHIVPLLSAGESGGLLYYTMPFVEGESLRTRLVRDGRLPVGEVIRLLRDVGEALAYAHEHGIVHRDIKPDNVLLADRHARVVDFGIAKALSEASTTAGVSVTGTGMMLGTPLYMAPEQAAGDPRVDQRTDLYALGAVAYEMLTGAQPFAGRSSPQQLLAAHLVEKPEPVAMRRADTPPLLAALVMRCLEKEPDARPQSAAGLLQALESVSSGGAYAAAPAIALASRRALGRALALYALAFVATALLARAAVVAIGLPEWVFPGALVVVALGLPAILVTALVHHQARTAQRVVPPMTSDGAEVRTSRLATLAVKARPHLTWRRAAQSGLYALGAFALLVTGYMLLRALGVGPAGSLLAAGKLKEREPLLVADFRASGADSALGSVVAEAVRTDLAQSPVVSVVPTSAIDDALGRMRLPVTTRLDLPVARELAQREGIRAVVSGDVTRLGAGYLVTMRLLAAESGDELAAFRETADAPKELIPTIDDLARRLRGKIGESLKRVNRSPPLEQVTTGSLDALRKYAEGSRLNDMGDYDRAIAALERAVALDTMFAMAYRKLAVAISNTIGPREREVWAITRAYRHRDRLTERERYLTIAWYARAVSFDRQQEAAAYEALLERNPTDLTALNNLVVILASRREFAAAESLQRRIIATRDAAGGQYGLVNMQLNGGNLSAAAATIDEAHRRFPNAWILQLARTRLLYNQGREDSVRAVYAELRRDRTQIGRSAGAEGLGLLALLHGRFAEWSAMRVEERAVDVARGAPGTPLLDSMEIARVAILIREAPAVATRLLGSLLARDSPPTLGSSNALSSTDLTAAALYALAGDPQRARAYAVRYDARVREPALRRRFEPARHEALAEIALAERRPLDAAREFRLSDSLPDGPVDSCTMCLYAHLGRAFALANMPDSAIAMFERYLATPDIFRLYYDALYLAGIYRRLGELYEGGGDREQAASYYARFVALWKDADPVLQPKVAEVRRRLARLSDAGRR